ncbi:MAG: 4Fe-4S binding protein [candidate division KSB1 bacterium]|nr:4Fe-4S binding protein [candidate division KSB1 bacterium]MDZ7303748.1 4Fe-4S binding protein [candidate division KSB1 bacterium]
MLQLTTYKSKRHLTLLLSTVFIIILPFLNILRLDIPTLRFYFLNSVLWIDEFYLLFLVVMLLLWIIVIFSMIYGRVWCGWMCPQTVLNELVRWCERKIRKWLRVPKRGGFTWRHLGAYALLSLAVATVALVIGFNLVAYFVDPYRMLADIAAWQLGPVTTGIIVGIALLAFVDVMFWREKFCTKACPYGMMQMVVTDRKTQIVRFHTERSDECIECKACVRDCMMGIDIRTSPYQTECIHCGDCVDSCTAILARLKKPTLITFSWGQENGRRRWFERLGLVDPKRWGVVGITAAYAIVLVMLVQLRQPLSLSISGDRSTLYRQVEDGSIYNDYSLKISNRSMEDGEFRLQCASLQNDEHFCHLHLDANPIFLKSREVKILKMTISTTGRATSLHPGPNRLKLVAVNTKNADIRREEDVVFFMPEPGLAHVGQF